MANESKILPLVIGAINERESYTSAKINCSEDKASDVKDVFSGLEFEVLFPSQDGDHVVPLIGGAIAKIKLGKNVYESLESTQNTDISRAYEKLVNRINKKLTSGLGNLQNFMEGVGSDPEKKSISDFAEMHIKVNSFLEKTRFFEKNLQSLKIPTLRLSSIISSEFATASSLNSEIERARSLGTRPNGLSNIGSFKFIPFETIDKIYEIITPNSKGGFASNISLSGNTFSEITSGLKDLNKDSDDELISKAILNIFPILRLKEDLIDGEDSQSPIGFYTIYNDCIYVKTPDLSGRDSSGVSSNIYDLGVESDEKLNFAFEMTVRSNYGAISFDHLSPANIILEDDDYDFPAEPGGSVKIQIAQDGLGEGCQYYLSPILSDTSAKIVGVKNVKTISDGIEFFTAPNLSVPYFKDDLKPLFNLSEDDAVNKLGGEIGSKLAELFSVGTTYNSTSKSISIESKGSFGLSDFGVPLFVNESLLKTTSSQYCGIVNRPDIFLGRRDDEASYRRNDRKYFSDKIYASKEFFMSLTPNIARESQIPKLWIKASDQPRGTAEEDVVEIEFGSSGDFSIDDFRSAGNDVEFALYCVDKLGQVSRASGPNITLKKASSLLISLTPNGFKDSNAILKAGVVLGSLKIQLDNQEEFKSLKVYDNNVGGSLLFTINADEVGVVDTGSGFDLSFNKPIEDIFGTNTGRLWLSVNDSDNRLALFIADTSTTNINQLPDESEEKVIFEDPNGLKAQGFGRVIDSVPILLNGLNAEIKLKYNKKVFKEGAEIYAYLAVNDSNNDILSEDIGYAWDLDNENGIKFANIAETTYHIPTNIEWKFGSQYFSRVNNKKAILSFPGPAGNLNISRFNNFIGTSNLPPAYIVLSNTRIKGVGGTEFNLKNESYTIIPVGSPEGEGKKPAFINPPHILGMVAKIPGKKGSASFAITTSSNNLSDYFDNIRGINQDDVTNNSTKGPIITSDGLDRLSLIFTGSNSEKRISKAYTAYIGSKKIKSSRAGGVVRLDEDKNLLLLNFKKIRDIKDVGWTNITISKKDRRFKVNYDSTVYSRSTIEFDCSAETPDPNCSEGEILEIVGSGNNEKSVLKSGEYKNLLSKDGSGKIVCSKSANIFPDVNNYGLSPLPYFDEINTDTTIKDCDSETDIAGDLKTYAYFRNPIKVYPDSDLYLNLFLSDIDTEKNKAGEFVAISTTGATDLPINDAPINLDDAKSNLEKIRDQASDAKGSLEGNVSDLEEELSNTGSQGAERSDDEIRAEKDAIQEQLDAYNKKEDAADEAVTAADAKEAEAEAARQALEDLDEDATPDAVAAAEGALAAAEDAAAAAVGAVNDAVDAVNDALNILNDLSDKLSRLAMIANGILNDVEDALSTSKRADDFYGVDIKNVFIQKDAAIKSANITSNGDKDNFKLSFGVRFDQVAAIKFNSPEIISIIRDHINNKRKLPADFKDIKIDGPTKLVLETIGTNKGTKLEINRRRTSFDIIEEQGIFKFLSVEIDPEKYSKVGKDPCLEIALTNSNENRIRLSGQVDNDLAIDIDSMWSKHIGGGDRVKQGPIGDLMDKLSDNPLRFINVKLDKANIAKELMQSFCDMSFHLTAELSLQLRNFKVLLVPIKVILCIIDVICALLHPIRLAFAIIRLFLCLYDLILLLPQLAVPAMLLSLILHILELLLCVIIKILSIVNAINEIITALDVAIEEKNYPAIVALEETLNEHLFSLEADLQVLEPILTIFGLFLELLELVFAFPCQVGADEDDPACIDPSMLAGIILGKVAPFGTVAPDALLPLAQTYATLEPGGSTFGNTPSADADNAVYFSENDILKEAGENAGAAIVPSNAGYGGNNLTGLIDSVTGQPVVIGDGGFFSGDENGDGRLDNVDYTTLRFNEADSFEASFGISFTKSTKKFNLFTGPDPRLVEFQFNERGLTSPLAFNWFLALFFKKKNIELYQTLDSPPGFVVADEDSLIVNSGEVGFTSPVDGASDFNGTSFAGFYLDDKGGGTYQPKALTAKIELETRSVDQETGEETVTTSEEFKTFANVPMIAMVDDEFNVYFVQEGEGGTGGIVVEEINGVQCITSIGAKMINYPSAPKKKFSREDREVYRDAETLKPKSGRAQGLETGKALTGLTGSEVISETASVKLGQILIYEQANANWLSGEFNSDLTAGADEGSNYFNDGEFKGKKFNDDFGIYTAEYIKGEFDLGNTVNGVLISGISDPPFPEYGVFDWTNGSIKERNDFGDSIDSIKVFDFPTLYFIDMRHVADDIAAACGSKPTELLLDQEVFTEDGQSDLNDLVEETRDCVQSFKDFFLSQKETATGIPDGIIPKVRVQLAAGTVPEKIDVNSIIEKFNSTKACLEDKVDKSCKFVINPLNTSFKLLNDIDETPLTNYVDPEQEGLANLINYDLVDELEFDTELQGFPKITGAMEYASGIGDSAAVKVGEKALLRIIPRDCYDETLPISLDLTNSITIDILEDETGSAELTEPEKGSGNFIKSDGEYTAAITASSPGVVKIKATVCSVTIQAVTDRSIVSVAESEAEVDCVDDSGIDPGETDDVFAPGALTKVDRVLTILFVSAPVEADIDDSGAKLAVPRPQVFGTNLEN